MERSEGTPDDESGFAVPLGREDADVLAARTTATPDALAVVDPARNRSIPFRTLDALADETAARLADAGVEPGCRLAVCLDGGLPLAVLVWAAVRRGVTLVLLEPRLDGSTLAERVGRAGVDHLVVGTGLDDQQPETAGDDQPLETHDGADGIDRLDAADLVATDVAETTDGSTTGGGHDSRVPARNADGQTLGATDDQWIVFTSGTTGTATGVRLTARNLLANALGTGIRVGASPADRLLAPLPAGHVASSAPIVRSALWGATLVCQRRFDPTATASVLADETVSILSLVPTALRRLLDDGWQAPAHLHTVLVGGGPVPDALVDRALDAGVPIAPTYGATETASGVTIARTDTVEARPGTVGQPILGTDVAVLDDDSTPCSPGETGAVVVRGPTVSPGTLDGDLPRGPNGGVRTGDLGHRDDDGYLWIDGRADDRILTGGETVDPSSVSAALCTHSAVVDAVVVGLPDAEWGERVVAMVTTADGADVTPGELRTYLDGRVPEYAVPKTVVVTDELPRTSSGTVDRERVRQQFAEHDE